MDGIERIKVLASEIKDEQTLQIINYLLSRKDMNDKYLNEEKSLKQMLEFIGDEVKKNFELIPIGSGVKMTYTTDDYVYGLAIHYWDESNKDLGLDKKLEKKEEKNKQPKKNNSEVKEIIKEEEKIESTKSKKREWVAEGQLSLF